MKLKYDYVFATKEHWKIEKFEQLYKQGRWGDWCVLGFYLKDRKGWISIGSGELRLKSRKWKDVHTEAVGLFDDARRKGHGIHLYFALIRAAKSIGARRIYSSQSLNKFSGNMWCNKLREFFNVVGPKARKLCSCRCRRCQRQWGQYYIDLTKISLRNIPR